MQAVPDASSRLRAAVLTRASFAALYGIPEAKIPVLQHNTAPAIKRIDLAPNP